MFDWGILLVLFVGKSTNHPATPLLATPTLQPLHFPDFLQAVEKRNKNFQQIIRQLRFNKPGFDHPLGPMQHDILIFMGDLNYRIGNIPYEQIISAIDKQDWALLRRHDQLDQQLQEPVFDGWRVAVPEFAPTYRYAWDIRVVQPG